MQNVVNTEQEQAWNGDEGAHWARHQERWDAVNEGFDEPLLAAAAILADDTVLDIGCGAGATTRLAARCAPGGRATGLDLSAPMLERARASARAENLGNVDFERGDAQVHPLEGRAFDVAISRFGVMFFADPVAAFANIRAGLRPGGRAAFVVAAAAEDNEWLQALARLRGLLPLGGFGVTGGPGMFSLADPGRVHEVLAGAGFGGVAVERVEADGRWGSDAEDATAFLMGSGPGRHLLAQVDEATGQRARRELVDVLRAYERDGAVRMRSTAWLVTGVHP
ncbi:class I SAM-dependent methyltransferase [Streptomyces sp. PKU-EA00015]|uniref:class I SAM-dependent methyltransferase n=1 Tax=Streptomyces sp. PKU-EA00015 TaxID=2748326 RepID=UPI0015A39641|nr:class I SAM-dependent methyltransferase [Streptomyces sp. PKU-EA00015]NWF27869.1 class I SAM-dependent methyltransferase [Streptomyces sp. PKU-EA00015]